MTPPLEGTSTQSFNAVLVAKYDSLPVLKAVRQQHQGALSIQKSDIR
jgi:hypothetical protein